MRSFREWLRRNVEWRLPRQSTAWDKLFRGSAVVDVADADRPELNGKPLDDWVLQTIAMCPAGGKVVVARGDQAISLSVSHADFIESPHANLIEVRVNPSGQPYLYFDLILFDTKDWPGFGTVAFYRAAQAAKRVGFAYIELLAAGGQGYKYHWSRPFNGFHSWARYGFDAALWPSTLQLIDGHPTLAGCTRLLDIIDRDPEWWKHNGDGCDLTFDLANGSRSWYTLHRYLSERRLK